MAIHQIFVADIINGQLLPQQEKIWQQTLRYHEDKEHKVKIIIKPFKAGDSIRSMDANAYYWGVVIEILRQEFGYEKEEMHDALGLMFRRDFTKAVPTIINTSTMSSADFWEYISRIRTWAAVDYNITIPDPNKVST
jgi:hypothetical protein